MPSADRPLIIDIEASGFGGASYPIEIGLARGHDPERSAQREQGQQSGRQQRWPATHSPANSP